MSIPSYRSPNFGNNFHNFSKGNSNSKLFPLNWHDSASVQNAGGLDAKQTLLISGGMLLSAVAVAAIAFLGKSKPSVTLIIPTPIPVSTPKKPTTPPPPAWDTSALPVFATDFWEKIEAAEKALHDKDGKLPDNHQRAGYIAHIEKHTPAEFDQLKALKKGDELTDDLVESLLSGADLRTKLALIHHIFVNKNLRKEIISISYPIRDPKVAGDEEIKILLKDKRSLNIPVTAKEWNFTTSDQWKEQQYRLLPPEIAQEFQLSKSSDARAVIYEHKQPSGFWYRTGLGSGY